MGANRKSAKGTGKTRAQMKAAAKAAYRAVRETNKAANLASEAERATEAQASREAKAKAHATRRFETSAKATASLIARRVSQERAYTVRLRFVSGSAELHIVKVDAKNPRNFAEARVARKVRAEVSGATGLTSDGDLPGLTYSEAERIHAGLARKLTPNAKRA